MANYDSFIVNNETLGYVMYVSGYSGNASDSFTYHTGMMFTTKDRDNDQYSGNCAIYNGGGFWYNNCAHAHVAIITIAVTVRCHLPLPKPRFAVIITNSNVGTVVMLQL